MCVACRLEKTINPHAPTLHETGFGIAANIGTAADIALNSPVIETIDFTGDQDWFRITLQAGGTYAVALTGLTLSDPFLSVHNGGGTQIAFDDDGGVGLNAFLTFTSTFGGTHYLSAGAFGAETGSYELLITRTDAGPVARDDYTATTATSGVVGLGLDATGTIETGAIPTGSRWILWPGKRC
ncbi:PPC domain-containing protein [Rhodophyticola sp.]|uniref:PPC domain-containing protein n=1 Tax=Rhodophyticola sp. TaxID=2680032 RepID=UPI003D2BC663